MNKIGPSVVGIKPFPGCSCVTIGGSFLESGMDTKVCLKCGEEKLLDEFHMDRSRKDRLHVYCKVCRVALNRVYNSAHLPEHNVRTKAHNLRYPMRYKARYLVRNAIKTGKLIRPDRCSNPECNKLCKPEAHHHNGYDEEHWLDIIFLCTECHKIADKKTKEDSDER